MSAYVRDLRSKCSCGRKASYEVFNRVNASQGVFCGPCARTLARRLNHELPQIVHLPAHTTIYGAKSS
jgi:hypothetical protein